MVKIILNPGESPENKSLSSIVEQQVANGVAKGIEMFLVRNNVNIRPSRECEKPLEVFMGKLLAEYLEGAPGYPFKDSLRQIVLLRQAEESATLQDLYENKEFKSVEGLARMAGAAAVLEFLDAHREEALRVIREIRGDLPSK